MSKKSKQNIYFTQDTENAILEYNNTECTKQRNKIYRERIQYAFEKLAENILNTFKFSYFDIPKEDVQQEVVSFLIEKIHMYKDSAKGKAYSYFSITAKNYLILNNNTNFRTFKAITPISHMPDTFDVENNFYTDANNAEISEFNELMISYWELHLTSIFTKKRDIQIADAILELFRRSHYIENFNKKHLYLLIREMTGYKSHYITKIINIMKNHQEKLWGEYNVTGYVNMNCSDNSFFN